MMSPSRKSTPEKATSNALVSWAKKFLAAFCEEHQRTRAGEALPRFALSESHPRYTVCQVSFCNALLTHAPDQGAVARHILEETIGAKAMRNVENLHDSEIPKYFKEKFLVAGFHEKFEETCRGWLMGFIIPLTSRKHPLTTTISHRSQIRGKKDRCLTRDGHRCPLTGIYDRATPAPLLPAHTETTAHLSLAHLVPPHVAGSAALQNYYTIFTGRPASNIRSPSLNRPKNGLVLEANAHRDFAAYRWGIEAHRKTYRAVKIAPGFLSFKVPDAPIVFGRGGRRSSELPDEQLCGLHLAVGRVLWQSGVAGVVNGFSREVGKLDAQGEWGDETENVFGILERKLLAGSEFVIR